MDKQAAAMLKEAAALIRKATRELDTARDRCPTCGQIRAQNFKEFSAHRKLAEIPNKLIAVVNEIEEQENKR